MENITPIDKKINDFIYEKPDVAVVILQQYGYDINLKTATLPQITKLVYTALYINQDKPFAEALDNAIANDGENNIIAGVVVAIASSVIGGVFGGIEGDKNRDLQKKLALLNCQWKKNFQKKKLEQNKKLPD